MNANFVSNGFIIQSRSILLQSILAEKLSGFVMVAVHCDPDPVMPRALILLQLDKVNFIRITLRTRE